MKRIRVGKNISSDRLPQHHELSHIKTLAINSRSRLDYVQNGHSARSDLNEIINLIEQVEDEVQKLRMYKTNVADTFAGTDRSMLQRKTNIEVKLANEIYGNTSESHSNWVLQSKIKKLKEMFEGFNLSYPFIAPGIGRPLQGVYNIIGNAIVQSQFDQFIGSYEQGQTERLKRIAQNLINGPSVSIPNAVINKLYEDIKAIPSCVAVHDYLREHPEIAALIPTLMLNELPKDVQLDASRIRFEWNEERKQKIREEYIERKKRETEYWKAYEEAVRSGKIKYVPAKGKETARSFSEAFDDWIITADEASEAGLLTENKNRDGHEWKGVGMQGTVSGSITGISGSLGIEIIWFVDEDFDRDLDGLYTNDSKLIPYIYVFGEGAVGLSTMDESVVGKSIDVILEKMIDDTLVQKSGFDKGMSGSAFAIFGDDDFNNPYDYLGSFDTKSLTTKHWKWSYAQDPAGNVHTYGVGRDTSLFAISTGRAEYVMINPEEIEGLVEKLNAYFDTVSGEAMKEVNVDGKH